MSAIGPKQTSLVALHMSAFRGKADMAIVACPLLRSLLGAKQTCKRGDTWWRYNAPKPVQS
jgi:hypothetical protein